MGTLESVLLVSDDLGSFFAAEVAAGVMRYQAWETEVAAAMSEPEIEVCNEELDCAYSDPAAKRNANKTVNGAFNTADIGISPLRDGRSTRDS